MTIEALFAINIIYLSPMRWTSLNAKVTKFEQHF